MNRINFGDFFMGQKPSTSSRSNLCPSASNVNVDESAVLWRKARDSNCQDGYQLCWMSCLPIDSSCPIDQQVYFCCLISFMFGKLRQITQRRLAIRKKLNNRVVLTLVFDHFWTRLVFVLRVNTILGFQNRALTQLRAQTFKIRLELK